MCERQKRLGGGAQAAEGRLASALATKEAPIRVRSRCGSHAPPPALVHRYHRYAEVAQPQFGGVGRLPLVAVLNGLAVGLGAGVQWLFRRHQ